MRAKTLNMPMAETVAPKGCSSLKLRQLSRRVSQQFDELVSEAGMKTTQYSLLSSIVRLGPVRPGQLAALMEMDASTLTRNLQPLVARGWVVLEPGTDARSRQVRATEEGAVQQALARKAWKRAQSAFNDRLGLDRVMRLHAVLDECLEALHEKPASDDT